MDFKHHFEKCNILSRWTPHLFPHLISNSCLTINVRFSEGWNWTNTSAAPRQRGWDPDLVSPQPSPPSSHSHLKCAGFNRNDALVDKFTQDPVCDVTLAPDTCPGGEAPWLKVSIPKYVASNQPSQQKNKYPHHLMGDATEVYFSTDQFGLTSKQ